MESNHHPSPSIVLPILLACSSVIGEDLLIEIFKRLPAKTLCQFLCVCKSWKSLISSTPFIKLHHAFTRSAAPPNLKPYLRVQRGSNSYVIRKPQQLPSIDHLERQLHFPFGIKDDAEGDSFTFVDVIHGVVCISYNFKSRFSSEILWNPSIHRSVALPWAPFPVNLQNPNGEVESGVNVLQLAEEVEIDCSIVGFGYDISNNDFKVVRIWIPSESIQPYSKPLSSAYGVYSYRAGIWKVATTGYFKASDFFDHIRTSKTGYFINGSINWIMRSNNPWKRHVLMFDCEGEGFRVVDLPEETMCWRTCRMQKTELMEYAGMLSLVADSCLDRDNPGTGTAYAALYLDSESPSSDTCVELWVMKEHGVASSWKRLYRYKITETGFVLTDVYDDSFVALAPYGPKLSYESYDEILYGHVYEESMFLMDDAEATSYTDEDILSFAD